MLGRFPVTGHAEHGEGRGGEPAAVHPGPGLPLGLARQGVGECVDGGIVPDDHEVLDLVVGFVDDGDQFAE